MFIAKAKNRVLYSCKIVQLLGCPKQIWHLLFYAQGPVRKVNYARQIRETI